MHRRLSSTTLSQLTFPRGSNPNFLWEKSHWDNTVGKSKLKKKGKVKEGRTRRRTIAETRPHSAPLGKGEVRDRAGGIFHNLSTRFSRAGHTYTRTVAWHCIDRAEWCVPVMPLYRGPINLSWLIAVHEHCYTYWTCAASWPAGSKVGNQRGYLTRALSRKPKGIL